MKKYLLILCFFVFGVSFSYSASPLQLFNYVEKVVGAITDDELIAYAQLRNTTDQPVEFTLNMEFLQIQMGHEAAVCWELCYDYTDLAFLVPGTTTLGPNESSLPGQFSAHLHPYKRISLDPLVYSDPVEGETIIKFTFTPVNNPEGKLEYVVTFVVDDPSSVDDELSMALEGFYPNPSQNFINLNLSNSISEQLNINIFDINGNRVKSLTAPAGTNSQMIDVADLATGSYLININNGKVSRTKQFQVVK